MTDFQSKHIVVLLGKGPALVFWAVKPFSCYIKGQTVVYSRYTHSRNSFRQTTKDPQNEFLSGALLIRIYLICVHYYSKPNNAQKFVCVKQKIVLRVFVLTRFYCTFIWKSLVISNTIHADSNTPLSQLEDSKLIKTTLAYSERYSKGF